MYKKVGFPFFPHNYAQTLGGAASEHATCPLVLRGCTDADQSYVGGYEEFSWEMGMDLDGLFAIIGSCSLHSLYFLH